MYSILPNIVTTSCNTDIHLHKFNKNKCKSEKCIKQEISLPKGRFPSTPLIDNLKCPSKSELMKEKKNYTYIIKTEYSQIIVNLFIKWFLFCIDLLWKPV